MKKALILLALLSTVSIAAQKRVIIGGPDPEETKDWPKPEVRAGLTQPQKLANITAYGQKLYDANHFSGVVLVAKDGEPQLTHAWGLCDVATKTTNTLDTRVNIGAMNKFFTKAAIAQPVGSGKLSPDDTIPTIVPDYLSPAA